MKLHKKEQIRKQKYYFNKDFSYQTDYEKSLNYWRKYYLKRINENFPFKRGKKILDIGCGSGYAAIEMAKKGFLVMAVDISDVSVKILEDYKKKVNLKNLTVLLSDAEDIKLKKNSFDYIIANGILEHLVNEKKAIECWKKLLKKEGKIFITVPLKMIYIWPFLWPINFIYDRVLGHLRRYSKNDLEKKFSMNAVKTYYTGHLIKTVWIMVSRLLMGGVRKSSSYDYIFEDIDWKMQNISYGANNLIAVLKKS